MKKGEKRTHTLLAGAALSLALVQPSQALDSDLTLYLWGASVSGTATLNSQTIPVEADFDDVLDKLEMGFMMHYEGVGDRWGIGLDYTYIGLGNTNDAGVTGDVDATLAEAFAIYRTSDVFNLLGGVRYTGLDMAIEGPGGMGSAEGDRSLTDFFIGGRVAVPFSDSWNGALRADVGAGDSDLVWNVAALLDWEVSDSLALRGGYRWLDYEVDKDDAQLDNQLDLGFDGPFLGVGFKW